MQSKINAVKNKYSTAETIEIATKIAVKLLQNLPLNQDESQIASIFLMDYVQFISGASRGGKVKIYNSETEKLEAQRKSKREWYYRKKSKLAQSVK